MAILAIDQGSSATKAIVVDDSGVCLAEASAPVQAHARAGGAVEYAPEEILESVLEAGRAALRKGVRVEAVGLANQGETVVAWDRRDGQPLGPALSWQDKRAAAVTDRLANKSARFKALTGLPLDPYFSGAKMRWLRERGVTGGVITTLDSWLLYRLSGEFITDASTASRTLLLDLASGGWSDEAFAMLGLDEERPRIVDSAGLLGTTTAFGAEVPITAAIVDQQAALYGLACRERGDTKCTYGTGAFVLANAGRQPARSSTLPTSIAWRLDGETTYCIDGSAHAAGAAVAWLERLGLLRAAAELDRLITRNAPPDALFLPALAGTGPPSVSSKPRGAWLDLSLATTAEDLVHAAVWGIAAEIARLAKLIAHDLDQPVMRLRVDGGLAACDRLLQAQSDLLGARVERGATKDATALGVAMLAARGLGKGPESQWESGWRPTAVFEPQLADGDVASWLERWEAAADVTAQLDGHT
jgi:glycerol kinase